MQQDNYYTEKKLQQLENQSLPDLSNMDEHWEEMKTLIKPAVKPVKPYSKPSKIYVWLAAASVVSGVAFFAYKYNTSVPKNETKKIYVDSKTSGNSVTKTQTADQKQNDEFVQGGKQKKLSAIPNAAQRNNFSSSIFMKKELNINSMDSVKIAEPKKLLENFFKQLEKNGQEFAINSQKDTMITTKEGTSLFIPANTFNSFGKVSITVKEFFSYADIIANRLSTMSDGQQLVTGGMFNISVSADGKQLRILPGKNITIFIPDSVANLSHMQLFQGKYYVDENQFKWKKDSAIAKVVIDKQTKSPDSEIQKKESNTSNSSSQLNWIPIPLAKSASVVTVLNLMNEPYESDERSAKFYIAGSCPLTDEQVKSELQIRYGRYYDRIKVKRLKNDEKRVWLTRNSYYPVIGDSTTMTLIEALRNKLLSKKDSAKFVNRIKADSINLSNIEKIGRRYSFSIKELGWINCDRFYKEDRPKFDYSINLNDAASNYSTYLIFDKIKSIMFGYASGNKVIFQNVPEGESVKVICAGVKNGKIVSAVHSTILNRKNSDNLENWVAAEENFKDQLAAIGK